MTWFKVDDKAHSHPKMERAGHEAIGLWALAGSWCSDQLTDGAISTERVVRLIGDRKTAHRLAKSLCDAGLWEQTETGFQFCGWAKRNPLAADVKAEKARKARNVADFRARRNQSATGPVTGYTAGKSPATFSVPDPDPDPVPIHVPSEHIGEVATSVAPATEPKPRRAKADRGTRCPSSVDATAPAWCRDRGLPDPSREPELRRMLDHFAAAPGQRGVKLDWVATWRNWSSSGWGKSGSRSRQGHLQGHDPNGEF